MPQPKDVALGIASWLSRIILDADPDTRQKLATAQGKCVCFTVDGWPSVAFILTSSGAPQFVSEGVHYDLEMSGPLDSFLALAGGDVAPGIKVSGDVALAQTLQTAMESFQPSVSEFTGPLLGDGPSQAISREIRRVANTLFATQEDYAAVRNDLHALRLRVERLRVKTRPPGSDQ